MKTEQDYSKQMQQAEEDYRRECKVLEEQLDEVSYERHHFTENLDDMAERLRYTFSKDESETQSLNHAYHIIQQMQEEGLTVIKQTGQKLEEKITETEEKFKKQTANYEEELAELKKERTISDA